LNYDCDGMENAVYVDNVNVTAVAMEP